jgi:hypothetical protein
VTTEVAVHHVALDCRFADAIAYAAVAHADHVRKGPRSPISRTLLGWRR